MALESFYGGRQGLSSVIKARFKYVNTDDPAYQAALSNIDTMPENERAQARKNLSDQVMDECFSRVDYTDVWYGELCIIDTENAFHKDNGKLFRRTLKRKSDLSDYTKDTLYAEYIGQIVGPSGGIPTFVFGSVDEVRKKAAGLLDEKGQTPKDDELNPTTIDTNNWQYVYPDATNEDAVITTDQIINRDNPIYIKYLSEKDKTAYPNISETDVKVNPINNINLPEGMNYNTARADDYRQIAVLTDNDTNAMLIPGQEITTVNDTEQIVYHDKLRYTWCNVRINDQDEQQNAWMYLGFEIPYPVFMSKGIDENYTYNDDVLKDISPRDENNYHPFAYNYEFHIPRGTRGIGPEEIFIVGKDGRTLPTTETSVYDVDAILYTQNGIEYIYDNDTEKYVVKNEQNSDQTSVLIYKEDNYYLDPNANPKLKTSLPKTYWVGKWNLYNPKTTQVNTVYQYLGSYKDIEEIQYNKQTGVLSIKYSSTETIKTYDIPVVKEISYTENTGNFTFTFTDNKTVTPEGNPLRYVNKWEVDPVKHELQGWYNNDTYPGDPTIVAPLTFVTAVIASTMPDKDSDNNNANFSLASRLDLLRNANPYYQYTDNNGITVRVYPSGKISIGILDSDNNFKLTSDLTDRLLAGKAINENNALETRIYYYDHGAKKWEDAGPLGVVSSSSGNNNTQTSSGREIKIVNAASSSNDNIIWPSAGISVSDDCIIIYPIDIKDTQISKTSEIDIWTQEN